MTLFGTVLTNPFLHGMVLYGFIPKKKIKIENYHYCKDRWKWFMKLLKGENFVKILVIFICGTSTMLCGHPE